MKLTEAKFAFDNGIVDSISFDFLIGSFVCVCYLKNGSHVTVQTVRGADKKYKSLDAMINDITFITGSEIKSLKAF